VALAGRGLRHRDGGAERADIASGEVDLPEQQHEHLGHAEQHEGRALDQQVRQVAGGEELRVL